MNFKDPQMLSWLWSLLVIFILIRVTRAAFNRKLKTHFSLRAFEALSFSLSTKKRSQKNLLMGLFVALLAVALARPQTGLKKIELKSEGVELLLVADVSESMMAEDVRPNRLEQLKIEMGRLIEKLPGHKIGLIGFAGSAALLSPLTSDPSALKMYLDSLSISSVSEQGTNFSAALEQAQAAFERGGVTTGQNERVTRVILVASDGEDNEPGAEKAAAELAKKGIRIFSMAYGTKNGGTIPVRDSLGFLKGNKRDRSGKEVVSAVNGDALKALANAGKGQFYFASFGGSHLDQLVNDINALEKTQFDSDLGQQFDENFQIFLWIALAIALGEIHLGERKAVSRVWRGRFGVSA